jgi:hypothetical protein
MPIVRRCFGLAGGAGSDHRHGEHAGGVGAGAVPGADQLAEVAVGRWGGGAGVEHPGPVGGVTSREELLGKLRVALRAGERVAVQAVYGMG